VPGSLVGVESILDQGVPVMDPRFPATAAQRDVVRPRPDHGEPCLTADGRDALTARLGMLEAMVADLANRLRDPEARADVVEVYQRATMEVERLRVVLDTAGTLDDLPDDPQRVDIGDRVSIRLEDGTEETYLLVHPAEAMADGARVSTESPLGTALLARQVGETLEVSVLGGSYRCTIIRAGRAPTPARDPDEASFDDWTREPVGRRPERGGDLGAP
jgi:transcription elongation GreA/GreB family factor